MPQRPSVLMIDDDDVDIFSIQRAIKKLQPAIRFEAIKHSQNFLEKIDDYAELPDAVLLDINMPVVDGYQILGSIQQHQQWKKIPVIMLTTSESPHDQEACLRAGATAFLTKPSTSVEMDSVLTELKHHLYQN